MNNELTNNSVPNIAVMKRNYIINTVLFFAQLVFTVYFLFFLNIQYEVGGEKITFISNSLNKLSNIARIEDLGGIVVAFGVVFVEIFLLIRIIYILSSENKYKMKKDEKDSDCYKFSNCMLFSAATAFMLLLNFMFYIGSLNVSEKNAFNNMINGSDLSIEDNSINLIVSVCACLILVVSYCITIVVLNRKTHMRHSVLKGEMFGMDLSEYIESVPKSEDATGSKQTIENMDILIKYKKLYDSGAITEEEFERKKKELLK